MRAPIIIQKAASSYSAILPHMSDEDISIYLQALPSSEISRIKAYAGESISPVSKSYTAKARSAVKEHAYRWGEGQELPVQKEASIFTPIWNATKFMAKNPYARRIGIGATTGAVVGGTANMMAGDVGSQGKNFAKGALIGAGVGAALGGVSAGRKAMASHKAVVNAAPRAPGMRGFNLNMNKTGSFFKGLKTVGKIAVPTAVLGGSLLYWNNRTKQMGKNSPRPYYEQQAPMLTYGQNR